jgi:DNA polymerase elongation subunit (family B)
LVASVLRTGKVPEILEAIELAPSEEHGETRPWRLFGDERYAIDLTRQDFFTEVINLRGAVKADLDLARRESRDDDAAYLDGLQLALKLLANSTSYGALVEVNADATSAERQPLTVYDWRTHETTTTVLERPGAYFAGAVGALIPAGGRLLLALAERLASDRGISYAVCDTDSMAFARPEDMTREVFHQRVAEIR